MISSCSEHINLRYLVICNHNDDVYHIKTLFIYKLLTLFKSLRWSFCICNTFFTVPSGKISKESSNKACSFHHDTLGGCKKQNCKTENHLHIHYLLECHHLTCMWHLCWHPHDMAQWYFPSLWHLGCRE